MAQNPIKINSNYILIFLVIHITDIQYLIIDDKALLRDKIINYLSFNSKIYLIL